MLMRMPLPIFVRPLSADEHTALVKGLHVAEAFVLRRWHMLLASSREERVPRIAQELGIDDQAVRDTTLEGGVGVCGCAEATSGSRSSSG